MSVRVRKAVDCMLNGIDDRAVRVGAQAARFREPEEILKYLKTVKIGVARDGSEKLEQRQDRKFATNSFSKRTKSLKTIVCHNCNEDGHKLVNCSTCGKLCHLSAFCRFTHDSTNNKGQKGPNSKEENQN